MSEVSFDGRVVGGPYGNGVKRVGDEQLLGKHRAFECVECVFGCSRVGNDKGNVLDEIVCLGTFVELVKGFVDGSGVVAVRFLLLAHEVAHGVEVVGECVETHCARILHLELKVNEFGEILLARLGGVALGVDVVEVGVGDWLVVDGDECFRLKAGEREGKKYEQKFVHKKEVLNSKKLLVREKMNNRC